MPAAPTPAPGRHHAARTAMSSAWTGWVDDGLGRQCDEECTVAVYTRGPSRLSSYKRSTLVSTPFTHTYGSLDYFWNMMI